MLRSFETDTPGAPLKDSPMLSSEREQGDCNPEQCRECDQADCWANSSHDQSSFLNENLWSTDSKHVSCHRHVFSKNNKLPIMGQLDFSLTAEKDMPFSA
jgi:hypothetical protein